MQWYVKIDLAKVNIKISFELDEQSFKQDRKTNILDLTIFLPNFHRKDWCQTNEI